MVGVAVQEDGNVVVGIPLGVIAGDVATTVDIGLTFPFVVAIPAWDDCGGVEQPLELAAPLEVLAPFVVPSALDCGGVLVGTELDMAGLLSALVGRLLVLTIPIVPPGGVLCEDGTTVFEVYGSWPLVDWPTSECGTVVTIFDELSDDGATKAFVVDLGVVAGRVGT
jgi:hypothetical protein